MTDSFWAGGLDALRTTIQDQYESKLSTLRSKLKSVEQSERKEVAAEIERIQLQHRSKLNDINNAIF